MTETDEKVAAAIALLRERGYQIKEPSVFIGQKFGMLTVESFVQGSGGHGKSVKWNCRCACGNTIATRSDSLRSGATKSCGCFRAVSGKYHNFGRRKTQTYE